MSGLRQEAARWFARMHDAGPDHPDRARFQAWLAASPDHAAEYRAFAAVWSGLESASETEAIAVAMERRQRTRRAVLRGGALAVTAGVAGSGLWEADRWRPVDRLALASGIGEVRAATLSDASVLTLGPDSAAEVAYSAAERQVRLARGEAIFEVRPNPARPFVVDAGGARVTVLGTRFAVSRLSDRVRVSVDHGRVRVETGPFWLRRAVVLTNGEVAEAAVAGGQGGAGPPQRSPRRAADGFAFARGEIVFDQARLAEIAETLSRYSRTPVRAALPAESGPAVTAVVQAHDIARFLAMLPRIEPVTAAERNGAIVLEPIAPQ